MHFRRMTCTCASWLFALGTVLLQIAPSYAATSASITAGGQNILLSAESMFRDSEKQSIELVGDVKLNFGGQAIRCDRAVIDSKNRLIVAEGNLIIASSTAYAEGSRAELSLSDQTGVIYNGFVKSGQVIFEGEVIRKTGPITYEAQTARYTACTTCPAAWSFSGSRIDAEIGGYAYIKNTLLRVGGVPIIWLPYLIVPLKSERQTGLLIPSIDYSGNGGVAVTIPFFWAISRSQDLTASAKFYSQRGAKALLNYRYVLSDESSGELNFATINDQVFLQDRNLPVRPGSERSNRWFLTYDHLYTLPEGIINRAKLNFVSDLRYPRDFSEEISGTGDSALENRISLTKNFEHLHSSLEAAYYINQLKVDPLEGNSDSVHRFPEIQLSRVHQALLDLPLSVSWNAKYVNFARDDFAFDDVIPASGTTQRSIDRSRGTGGAGSGSFEPDVDLIRTGQRIDFQPEVAVPFRWGEHIDFMPSLSLRHTQYSFNVTPSQNSAFDTAPFRSYVRGTFAVRTQFSRIFDADLPEREPANLDPSGQSAGLFSSFQNPQEIARPDRLRHEIEPEVSISGIPWLHQSNSKFFGDNARVPVFLAQQPVSDSDFFSSKGIQFDYNDRVTQRNVINFLINNRFVRKSWSGDTPVFRQIVSVKTGTSYDIDEGERSPAPGQRNFPWSDVYSIIDVRLDSFDTNTAFHYFPYHKVMNTTSRARVRDSLGNFLQTSYSQVFLITENIDEAYPKRTENFGLAAGFDRRYLSFEGGIDYLPVSYAPLDFRVKSWSTKFKLMPPGDCWGIRASFRQEIGKGVEWKFDFEYNFGGSTPGFLG